MSAIGGASDLLLRHGPVALIAGALAFACWKLVGRMLDRQDKQLEQRDEAHAVERKEDREAHLAALGQLSGAVKDNTEAINDLRRDLAPPMRQRGG